MSYLRIHHFLIKITKMYHKDSRCSILHNPPQKLILIYNNNKIFNKTSLKIRKINNLIIKKLRKIRMIKLKSENNYFFDYNYSQIIYSFFVLWITILSLLMNFNIFL